MKKILILTMLFITTLSAYCQENMLKNQKAVEFISEYCRFNDGNPTHQSEADSINSLIRNILAFKNNEVNVGKNLLQRKALEIFYENSIGSFEDGYDAYRMIIRRYLSFIALALLEDNLRYGTFLNDALACLNGIDSYDEVYIKGYAIIDIIATMIMMNFGCTRRQIEMQIEKLEANISLMKGKNDVTLKFINDYTFLTGLIIENSKHIK